MLEKAISIALEAHRGQIDKAGKPYILHPLRVMNMGKTEEEMICGVLHDVVEDTPISIDMLREEGFSPNILKALNAISRNDEETYEAYIDRVITDDLAIRVKLHDLKDNMNRDRILYPSDADLKRYEKYKKTYARLMLIMDEKNDDKEDNLEEAK